MLVYCVEAIQTALKPHNCGLTRITHDSATPGTLAVSFSREQHTGQETHAHTAVVATAHATHPNAYGGTQSIRPAHVRRSRVRSRS